MIPYFEKLAQSFADKWDPCRYLEKFEKHPLFMKYQNQYRQIETEEAVASTLCAYLEEHIKNKVKSMLGSVVASKMSTEVHFSNKIALKVRVLLDLLCKDDFDSFMIYIKDVKKCLVEHIQKYITEFCDRKAANSHYSELQKASFEIAAQIVGTISTIVLKPIPDNTTLEEWLSAICLEPKLSLFGEKLVTKNLICDYDPSLKLDAFNFQKIVSDHFQDLREKVFDSFRDCKAESEMKDWDVQPDNMFAYLIGCTAQCPFCGEQCDRINHTPDETKHYAEVHQQHIIGERMDKRTQVIYPNVCNMLVASDGHLFKHDQHYDQQYVRFKDYQDAYPDWYIPPDKTTKSTLYWKWFICKYETQLLQYYSLKSIKYPIAWKYIDKEAVEKDLQSVYNLH